MVDYKCLKCKQIFHDYFSAVDHHTLTGHAVIAKRTDVLKEFEK